MTKIESLIDYNLTVAEDLNKEKRKGINKLQNELNNCPKQWQQQTKKFIEVVKNNIKDRYQCISSLRKLELLKDDSLNVQLFKIISKLKELDKKDNIACDMYKAVMNEEL